MKAAISRLELGNGRVTSEKARSYSKVRARRHSQRGFTLVELLAVMAIIGILAGVVAGAVSGLGATGVTAQIVSDTKALETGADRFFNDSFPQAYPVEELPSGQTNLGVRAIFFDARLPQDPTKTFIPDFIKDIPNSAALVSYRLETATGNVFAAADGADFAPPANSRLNVDQVNKKVSTTSVTQTSDVTFNYTMRKNRAAVEILKVQIPAGYNIGGQSLNDGDDVGKLTIEFGIDNPWQSGQVLKIANIPIEATGQANEWDIVVDYKTASPNGSPVAGVLRDPTDSSPVAPVLTHTISITEGSAETPGVLTLNIDRIDENGTTLDVSHNRATETWTLTIFGTDPTNSGNLVINPGVRKVYRWLAEEQSTIQVEGVFEQVAGKQAILIKDPVTLTSIDVTPVGHLFLDGTNGDSQQFTATGNFSDGNTLDLTATVTWDSSDGAVATIDSAGLATVASGTSAGTTDITATKASVTSNSVTLNVTS